MSATAGSSTDPGWARTLGSLSGALASLDKATGSIKRTTKRVATASDVGEAKAKVDAIVLKAGQSDISLIHSMLQLVEKYARLHAHARIEAAKAAGDARMYLDRFQTACDAFEQRCAAAAKTAPSAAKERQRRLQQGGGGLSSPGSSVTGRSDDEGEELLAVAQKGPTQRERFEQELHEDALRDRSRDVREILDNVTDINEIFQHINQLVGEQGEQLDTVAVNVENAEEKTRKGVENLREAQRQQRQTKCAQLAAFFVVFVFLAIVLAVLTA